MGWLDGKVALITGGGSGIGKAVADRFIEEGASVAVLDIEPDRVEALEEHYDESSLVAIQGDTTSYPDNQAAVEKAVDIFGQLDIFVGNAGISDNHIELSDIPSSDLRSLFLELFEVNVLGYLSGAKAALPELRKTNGNMVFTASHASFNPGCGGILYTTSKHAVAGIVRQLAYELAPEIRVNGVAPGFAPTQLQGLSELDQETELIFEKDAHLLDNEPSLEDYVAYYVLFASNNSESATGSILTADYGYATPPGLE